MLWEQALFACHETLVADQWAAVITAHAEPVVPTKDQMIDAILQEAAEHAAQRDIAAVLAADGAPTSAMAPRLQMAFCIDVRSEVFRRALESVDPQIRTLGFAGFFGFTASHHQLGSDVAELRLPVLLNPGLTTRAGGASDLPADLARRLDVRVTRAWARFKLAAVSSFAFVEAAGPTYVLKLLRDALGLGSAALADDPAPRADPALDLATRAQMAESILRAMSLTSGFAPLVVVAGHGANVVNNPHASALHCGACGGYSGEVNARLLASLLNDAEVRTYLRGNGIAIPASNCSSARFTTRQPTRSGCSTPMRRRPIVKAIWWLHGNGWLPPRCWPAASGRCTCPAPMAPQISSTAAGIGPKRAPNGGWPGAGRSSRHRAHARAVAAWRAAPSSTIMTGSRMRASACWS